MLFLEHSDWLEIIERPIRALQNQRRVALSGKFYLEVRVQAFHPLSIFKAVKFYSILKQEAILINFCSVQLLQQEKFAAIK